MFDNSVYLYFILCNSVLIYYFNSVDVSDAYVICLIIEYRAILCMYVLYMHDIYCVV